MSYNPTEARDAHGRWTSGGAELAAGAEDVEEKLSSEEIQAALDETYPSVRSLKGSDPEVGTALAQYKDGGYHKLNKYLRTGNLGFVGENLSDAQAFKAEEPYLSAKASIEHMASKMDDAMWPMPASMSSFRSGDFGTFREMFGENPDKINPEKLIGAEILDRGFTSSSLNPDVPEEFAGDESHFFMFEIHVHKGQHAYYYGRHDSEAELVHARGSRYRVIDFTKNEDTGGYYVILDRIE